MNKKISRLLAAIVLVDSVGNAAILPILPSFLYDKSLILPHILGLTIPASIWLGLIFALFSVGETISSFLFGKYADRLGQFAVLRYGMVLFIFSQLLLIFALAGHSLMILITARFLGGFGAGNSAVVRAVISTSTEGKKRVVALGRIAAINASGLLIGPVAASIGILLFKSIIVPFALMLPVSLTILAALYYAQSPDEVSHAAEAEDAMQTNRYESLTLMQLYFILATYAASFSIFFVSINALLGTGGYSELFAAIFFSILGGTAIATQTYGLALLHRLYLSEERVVFAGLIIFSVLMLFFSYCQSTISLFILSVAVAMINGFIGANIYSLIGSGATKEKQGSAMGAAGSIVSMIDWILPLTTGLCLTLYGTGMVFVGAAAITAFGLLGAFGTQVIKNRS